MSVSRRRFLKHGAFAAIACAAIPSEALTGRRPDLDPAITGTDIHGHAGVARSAFEGLIGSPFKVTTKSGNASPVWLRLIAVSDLPAIEPVNVGSMAVAPKTSSPAPRTTGYILSFSAGGTSLTQDTYIFENDRMGKFPLFIVPAGPGQYTAVFNLLDAITVSGPVHNGSSPAHTNAAPAQSGSSGKGPVGGSTNSGSPTGLPAQEELEPLLGGRVKTQIKE
jgi:hypothetical protein